MTLPFLLPGWHGSEELIFRRTAAVVLRRRDYSETSKIVTFYTRDHGKVRAIAKGAKRKKSDFLGILDPLSLLDIVYIQAKGGLHILKEAHLIDANLALRGRLSSIAHGLSFLSLVEQTQPEEDPDPAVFELLSSSLTALQHVSCPENVAIVFALRLLEHFGRLPGLTACGRCGSALRRTAVYHERSAGLFCESCCKRDERTLSQGTLQAMRRLAETSLERCGRIRLSKKQQDEISRLIGTMLRAAIEAELPAERVVSSLLQ